MAVAAAGAVPVLKVQDEFADDANFFQYPDTCLGYMVIGDGTTKIHLILGGGAPSTDYNNAPFGSLYIDITNKTMSIKDAATSWGAFDITT